MAYGCEEYGYRILPRAEFMTLDRLEGFMVEDYSKVSITEAEARELDESNVQLLKERAGRYQGAHVLFDPYADDEGFMLVGDDADELDRQCCEHEQEIRSCDELDEPPLDTPSLDTSFHDHEMDIG